MIFPKALDLCENLPIFCFFLSRCRRSYVSKGAVDKKAGAKSRATTY